MLHNSDERITVHVHPALNREARVFGFPVAEFLMIIMIAVVSANANGYFFPIVLGIAFVLGKIRKRKPSNWLQFLPYLWFKVRYPYLLPPGRRTFLP